MRKLLLVLTVTASLAPATSAIAGPPIPDVPSNCHEWNQLLGIDNVQSCDGNNG